MRLYLLRPKEPYGHDRGCRDMDQDGFCTAIIIDQDPCGERWETEKVEED